MEGEQPQLGDLLTMVINHLLTGMILQVVPFVHWIETFTKYFQDQGIWYVNLKLFEKEIRIMYNIYTYIYIIHVPIGSVYGIFTD